MRPPTNALDHLRPRCCTNLASATFWTAMVCVLYGAALLLMGSWPGLRGYHAALALAVLGVACLASVMRNGTYHCAITGPLFLALSGAVALDEAGLLDVPVPLVWLIALAGTGIAFLLEYRFGSRQQGKPSRAAEDIDHAP